MCITLGIPDGIHVWLKDRAKGEGAIMRTITLDVIEKLLQAKEIPKGTSRK